MNSYTSDLPERSESSINLNQPVETFAASKRSVYIDSQEDNEEETIGQGLQTLSGLSAEHKQAEEEQRLRQLVDHWLRTQPAALTLKDDYLREKQHP